jgi:hypothetical protein
MSKTLVGGQGVIRSLKLWLTALASLVWFVLVLPANAHEVRPALLQITEARSGDYEVLWKQPLVGEMGLHLIPHLSGGALDRPPDQTASAPGFLVRTWRVQGGPLLDGQTIEIEGLSQTVTDVLVRVSTADGRTVNAVLHPSDPTLKLQLSGAKGTAVPAYLRLGIEHILTGIDHLAFVLGLLLLIGPNWRVIKAITAFTIAHSITLALAALGYIDFPTAVIEALVALSILFVATELMPRPGRPETLTRRHPWLIALVFGLLHGLAFAGALAQIGLPARAAPMALLLFNLGVEIGQIAFIATAIAAILALRWLRARITFDTAGLARLGPAYLIGGFSAYWLIDRLLIAFS